MNDVDVKGPPLEAVAAMSDEEIDLLAEQASAQRRLALLQRREMARLLIKQRARGETTPAPARPWAPDVEKEGA